MWCEAVALLCRNEELLLPLASARTRSFPSHTLPSPTPTTRDPFPSIPVSMPPETRHSLPFTSDVRAAGLFNALRDATELSDILAAADDLKEHAGGAATLDFLRTSDHHAVKRTVDLLSRLMSGRELAGVKVVVVGAGRQ